MKLFYFTYGSSPKMAYQGGWTTVKAANKKQAIQLFRAAHPDITEGIVNCASVYSEEEFRQTEMSKEGNLGRKEVEFIEMKVRKRLWA